MRRTARRTSRRVSRRQNMMSSEAAPPPEPAPAAAPDPYVELKKLGELHAEGILTDEEFAAQKAKILGI